MRATEAVASVVTAAAADDVDDTVHDCLSDGNSTPLLSVIANNNNNSSRYSGTGSSDGDRTIACTSSLCGLDLRVFSLDLLLSSNPGNSLNCNNNSWSSIVSLNLSHNELSSLPGITTIGSY